MESTTETERKFFGITPDIVFPIELSRHLKDKLKIEMEENWKLKRHIEFQDGEIQLLKKSNREAERKEKMNSESCLNLQSPQVAATIVELKRRNRDMTSTIESMKTKMQKLLNENDRLKDKMQEMERQMGHGELNLNDTASSIGGCSSKSNEELITSAQQLNKTTNKMMEYRRESQQLKLDLNSSLHALAQEIGEGATAKNVLEIVSNPTWRGRQQQIIVLNHKVAELQNKLSIIQLEAQNHASNSRNIRKKEPVPRNLTYSIDDDDDDDENANIEELELDSVNYENEIKMERIGSRMREQSQQQSNSVFSASNRHLAELQLQDKKKHEQIEKLTQELDEYKTQAKNYQQDKKAFKARTTTLENQIRSLRLEIEELDSKLQNKNEEYETNLTELNTIRQELMTVKIREKRALENNSLELHEAQQSLARERAVVIKLQTVLNERQELVQKMDGDIKRLQSNLDLCCSSTSSTFGRDHKNMNVAETIKKLKAELQDTAEVIKQYEKERQDLMNFTKTLLEDVDAEQTKHSETKLKLVKSFAVIDQTNDCLNVCLDVSQITSKELLGRVEAVRSLIREIKATGNLYSLESVPIEELRRLKIRVAILCRENGILHQMATKSVKERKRDLEQYGIFSMKLRAEFLNVLQNATMTFMKH